MVDEERDIVKHEIYLPPVPTGGPAAGLPAGAGVVFPSRRGGNVFEVADGRSKGKRVWAFEDVTAEGVKSWIAAIGEAARGQG